MSYESMSYPEFDARLRGGFDLKAKPINKERRIVTITERFEGMTADVVEKEIEKLDKDYATSDLTIAYKTTHRRLIALLRVLEAEQLLAEDHEEDVDEPDES